MNSNLDICDMKDDIMSTVTRVIEEVVYLNVIHFVIHTT